MRVIILMKILNENDMRSETGGSDSSMSTKAPTPFSYFGSSKVESLEMKNLQLWFLSLFFSASSFHKPLSFASLISRLRLFLTNARVSLKPTLMEL